jgi:hypothetical protein
VSTLADHAALAKAYQQGLVGKTTVSPAVRALQQRVVKGIAGTRAQALALADWVRLNIRYVAVYVGDGGVVPHAADEVLAAGYGDCKDHATLLEALLDAAGIPSTQALINGSDAYALPKIDAFAVLNHVINYVPGIDLFIDTTAANVAPGYLPDMDLAKTTILTKTGEDRRTPSSQSRSVTTEAWFRLDEPGFQSYELTRTMRGADAEEERAGMRDGTVPRVEGQKVDAGDTAGHGDEYVVRASLRFAWPLADAKSITVMPEMMLNDRLQNQVMIKDGLIRAALRHAYPCTGRDIRQIIHVPVPHGYHVAGVPAPTDLHTPQFDYVSHAVEANGEVVINQRYHEHPATIPCTPEESQARSELHATIVNDVMSPVVFKHL